MLTHLLIENFAVVQSLNIELGPGLTAITGETGAGKSIMVDALGLILGDRADSSIIRDGTEKAEICAVFDTHNNSQTRLWLENRDLSPEECIIRRSLNRDGRSRAFINDRPVTLSQLKEIGETLLDIHGQHEHQSLLSRQTHRRLLDEYAGATDLALQVEDVWRSWHALRDQRDQLISGSQQQQEQQELIRYQLHELVQLDLQPEELGALEQEQVMLANAGQILSLGQQVIDLCNGQSGEQHSQNCASQLNTAISLAQQMGIPEHQRESTVELLESAQIQIQEACNSLRDYLNGIEINPERQQLVEQRLSDTHQLARKHRVPPSELYQLRSQLESELEELGNIDERLEQLEDGIEQTGRRYQQLAAELSKSREEAALTLNSLITKHLHTMGMSGARFLVELATPDRKEPGPHGQESIEFLVSTNPGQTAKPLRKIASGGELSRISLAIQVVLANRANAATLIFDEVDVGIGGATSEVVGRLLRELGSSGQVLCVTHQPQVAALAHHHLAVIKNTSNGNTDSQVNALSEEEKVTEIARMLGGVKLTKQTIAHATEMINGADST